MWVQRSLTKAITRELKTRPSVVLTGARQSGKTSLLRHSFPEYDFVSLDLPVLADEAENSGETFLARFKRPLIIDEVQYAPRIFRYIKHEIDNHRNQSGRFILSGSQKFSLLQNASETLAGRVAILSLFTLSLHEMQAFWKKPPTRATILDYIWRGGYPEIHAKKISPSRFYADYTATYIERDLRQIINVRNLRQFNLFMRLCASRIGHIVSASALATETGINVNTAQAWLLALEASNIIILLPPYFRYLGKRIVKAPKLYFADTGLAAFLSGIESAEQMMALNAAGAFFENLVVTEAFKRLSETGAERNLFFYRDHHGREVDLIYAQGENFHLAECKLAETPDTAIPGFAELDKLAGNKVLSKTIITPAHNPVFYKEKNLSINNVLDFNYWRN